MDIEQFIKERTVPKKVGFDEVADSWTGRGLVFLSGGFLYLSNAYMNIRFIREFLKSQVPIEVWYFGKKEINKRLFAAIKNLGNIDFVDIEEKQKLFPMKGSNLERIMHEKCPATMDGWRNKSYAILHSRFREVVYLDSDCFLFQKPESLFDDSMEYSECRAIFSSDIDVNSDISGRKVDPKTFIVSKLGSFSERRWDYSKPNPLWELIGAEEDDLPEFESGFIMVDKHTHRDSLFLAWFLNENSDVTYQYLYGDKDTFHLAWAKTKASLYMLKDVSRSNGHISCKYKDSILFEHRVFDNKFNCSKDWETTPNNNSFSFKDVFHEYFKEVKNIISTKVF
jgi:alpha 1,2-mannosyltransferase